MVEVWDKEVERGGVVFYVALVCFCWGFRERVL